ncbi:MULTISPECIES: bifunctional hydroxymethylpyrimidine kinase/phosphomethylpyrimidine kinase [Acidobacterium]|uniref:hydroxymethylpyrimidine kinase n=1 Tax=Acidobacterium capsulatum (strain ATCC 51196 / DSM 11244 / BCRC 80197 / JCM 7670 / NBRC 15755 / NCIMB 13165 / 161) TaxID=240015 RepID=C1F301_ACIC5|nr:MULTISPECIES: bifunctional hydroxymethylpyrimidine kinase/phosphomethylpyrimidine kinase [Acidobacterium]ACO32782.1 phosphomethylpyrimidine kinase [Acidobacterium capsulatum ATCC 51196]HCT60142.1 bifunctional hydroxymethylpyrimidine kinase/phosphomethylpyrimidine kinase [Acidobacterium sp.]
MPSKPSGFLSGNPGNPHEQRLPETEPAQSSALAPAVVLTIAGFDPSSGAGITADLKVFAACQLYGVSAVTALTVQSTQGVLRSQPVDSALLGETLRCLQQDLPIAGVKIGMLGSGENVATVAAWLRDFSFPRERVVLDPVLRSSSGRDLLDASGQTLLREQLLPQTGWITPNLDELAALTGLPVTNREQMRAAAEALAATAGLRVAATGGHLDPPDDLLATPEGEAQWFPGRHLATRATHGTGCAFSSALLCRLVLGDSAEAAVAAAKQYVKEAMEAAYPIGRGRGPMHHLYRAFRGECLSNG